MGGLREKRSRMEGYHSGGKKEVIMDNVAMK